MKKLVILPILALLLTGCANKPSSEPITTDTSATDSEITTSEDTDSNTTPSSDIPNITISSQADTTGWDELMPYLSFALGDYAKYVPSYSSHDYHVSFQKQDDIVAVQVDCKNIRSTTAEDSYTTTLAMNEFQITDETPSRAYKLVSITDCLFITYLQEDTTFYLVAYYQVVRDVNWPTQLISTLVSKDVPVCEADAYAYQYGENARGYISVQIDCYSENGLNRMDNWLNRLSRAGYEYTNQSGWYTATSSDGEIIIQFDDYYGDGTCIEMSMYSLWPAYDMKVTFGFELPRYSGEYSNWYSRYMTLTSGEYFGIYYDGVTSASLTNYGNQLIQKGFTFDQEEFNDYGYYVYYLKGKTINGVYEPWLQLAYQDGTLVVAVPYTILES
ncbi:MAG: hypothetical protein MJ094_09690 [Saccharofermentans sp.]|nr:hypothetical protein [Saccharofermentans sp.]